MDQIRMREMDTPMSIGSPHINVQMKGDITKIEPLMSNNNYNSSIDTAGPGGDYTAAQNENDSREIGGTYPDGAGGEISFSDAGYQLSSSGPSILSNQTGQMSHNFLEAPASLVSHHDGLPQARQMDAIFRESQQRYPPSAAAGTPSPSTSWSNVVSSNAPSSPMRLGTRSISGETLLTSNMSEQPTGSLAPTNFHYLGTRSRSHSFDQNSVESPHRHILGKSYSFGNTAIDTANLEQQSSNSFGIPPSHPGHSSYKESTLPTITQGSSMHSPPMMMYSPSSPYQEYKPRSSSLGSYSSVSTGGDSMATDQTSPMSSPSLSPHVSPAMSSRKHGNHGPPPMWQLSDTNDYYSEPSGSPHLRMHSHLPQSIPEHQRHEPTAHHGHHGYMNHGTGPTSPQRRTLHHPSSSHHHSMYSTRRPGGPKPHSGPTASAHHHRSSTEVLKTLLRKKACLYEPETSLAVSVATWLVGRRLTLTKGYFTRQQLQSGVHSCVACKIAQGHVTRTKVNRCMQVILNSCFHYIIPRPDGSEECGAAFRTMFAREAADEEHLLGTLPPPWNDLTLPALNAEEESHSSLFQDSDDEGDQHPQASVKRPTGSSKEQSSNASQAGDSSLESSANKRSVLLCFNENIRCAADVFRCHNEFIRDVAHTGNLNLSPDDWQAFFSGTNAYRKRGQVASNSSDGYPSRHFHLADVHDRTDRHGLSKLRTSWCAKRYEHDHSFCAFAHVDVNRGWLRRDPLTHDYQPIMCPYVKPLQQQPNVAANAMAEECYVNMCPLGVKCNHVHSKEELEYHPENYKTQPCRYSLATCPLGDICPNTHDVSMSSSHYQPQHGRYNRQGKRHYHDHPSSYRASTHQHLGSKRRVPTTSAATAGGGHISSGGFNKLPDGSPMLYIDPAPLSEFEETLQLPGLQAIFRDHSASIFYSTLGNSSPYVYGPFGYYMNTPDHNPQNSGVNASSAAYDKPIGKVTKSY